MLTDYSMNWIAQFREAIAKSKPFERPDTCFRDIRPKGVVSPFYKANSVELMIRAEKEHKDAS